MTERARTRGGPPRVDPRAAWGEVRRSPAALYSTLSVAVLFGYLLVRKPLEPGFTDHWGYMIVQIAGTLVLMLVLTVWSAPQGGFSWYTYLVVAVNTWADTLGTAGHLYDRHASYDKVTHFLTGVALTAAAADILRILSARGRIRLRPEACLLLAIGVALVLNVGWEVYEYVGDALFESTRHRGHLDTAYDLGADLAGALVSAAVLLLLGRRALARAAPDERLTTEAPVPHE